MSRAYRLGNPMRIPMIKRIVGRAAFGYKMSNKPTAIEAIMGFEKHSWNISFLVNVRFIL